MRAIVIREHGDPDVLDIVERPEPIPAAEEVLIQVKAFGLNHAECYFRAEAWGEVAEITGIECVGIVRDDPGGQFALGQKVVAIVGGMGRTRNGSYAELVTVPRSNVAAIKTDLPWEELAAIPESYATAWTAIIGILELKAGQTVLIRGATSALGQASVNIAREAGAHVIGTTRHPAQAQMLRAIGVDQVLVGDGSAAEHLSAAHPGGIDAVLDIVGSSTILDSLACLKRNGIACQLGFLGGGGPLTLDPVFQIPSGRRLTTFASAAVTGGPDFPLAEIPFQTIVDRAARGDYQAKPARVLRFEDIREGHRLMESGKAGGKIVVTI